MKKFSKTKGFTLAELMAVIGIIGILSAVGIVSFSSSRKTMALKAAQNEVASAIKLAQSYALQGRMNGGTKPDGYGFEFITNDTYKIFADDGSKTSVETKTLSNGITITTPPGNTTIIFAGDYGQVGLPGGVDLTITLQSSGGSLTKTVTVNKQGFIREN